MSAQSSHYSYVRMTRFTHFLFNTWNIYLFFITKHNLFTRSDIINNVFKARSRKVGKVQEIHVVQRVTLWHHCKQAAFTLQKWAKQRSHDLVWKQHKSWHEHEWAFDIQVSKSKLKHKFYKSCINKRSVSLTVYGDGTGRFLSRTRHIIPET